MKKFFVVFALFLMLMFVVACGGDPKNDRRTDIPDTADSESDDDEDTADSEISGNSDTTPDSGDSTDDADSSDSQDDSGDSTDDADSSDSQDDTGDSTDDGDSGADTGDDGDSGSSTLPECSKNTTSFPCKDSSTSYIWSAKNTYGSKTWQQAKDYCTGLNTSNYGGFSSGWHLPTISELRTLIQNCSATQMPPVGSNTCGVREDKSVTCLSNSCWTESACYSCDGNGGYSKFGDTGWFWSSSFQSDGSYSAWSVGFSYGFVDDYIIGDLNYVRCVR